MLLAFSAPAGAATRTIALGELAQPVCEPARFDPGSGKCVAPADLDQLGEAACPKSAEGFSFSGGKCQFDAAKAAPPRCNQLDPNLVYDAETKLCARVVATATSAPGSYVGDCFTINSEPTGTTLRSGRSYLVTEQKREADDDRTLTLVSASINYVPVPGWFGCKAQAGPLHQVRSSTLAAHGARRHGWAYGALAMPYKYFLDGGGFQTGLPVGAYVGWREGQSGSGTMLAAAITLSQVKADTLGLDADGNPAVTGSTDVAALSWALGLVFDVSKEPNTKAFKTGFFIGQDRINKTPTIHYKRNGKTWIAIQVGFDFTDY